MLVCIQMEPIQEGKVVRATVLHLLTWYMTNIAPTSAISPGKQETFAIILYYKRHQCPIKNIGAGIITGSNMLELHRCKVGNRWTSIPNQGTWCSQGHLLLATCSRWNNIEQLVQVAKLDIIMKSIGTDIRMCDLPILELKCIKWQVYERNIGESVDFRPNNKAE